jgi:NADP-dependent 3-hydroxy acid dehydrogenase YdfG
MSFTSVHGAEHAEHTRREKRIDVLFANAGVMAT